MGASTVTGTVAQIHFDRHSAFAPTRANTTTQPLHVHSLHYLQQQVLLYGRYARREPLDGSAAVGHARNTIMLPQLARYSYRILFFSPDDPWCELPLGSGALWLELCPLEHRADAAQGAFFWWSTAHVSQPHFTHGRAALMHAVSLLHYARGGQ